MVKGHGIRRIDLDRLVKVGDGLRIFGLLFKALAEIELRERRELAERRALQDATPAKPVEATTQKAVEPEVRPAVNTATAKPAPTRPVSSTTAQPQASSTAAKPKTASTTWRRH